MSRLRLTEVQKREAIVNFLITATFSMNRSQIGRALGFSSGRPVIEALDHLVFIGVVRHQEDPSSDRSLGNYRLAPEVAKQVADGLEIDLV